MLRNLARRSRHEAGQALAEYGILLALLGGATAARQAVGDFLAQPYNGLIVGGVVAVVLVLAVAGRR